MKVVEWQEEHGHAVVTWHYEPPYDFYDLASDPDDKAAMADPAQADHRRAVLGDGGSLEAFLWFDWHDDVVEVGIGVRPDLTGRGLGESFFRAQLEYASELWHPATFRLFVTVWNERAIRLYERLGFLEVARETRHFELCGDHEFIQMERPA